MSAPVRFASAFLVCVLLQARSGHPQSPLSIASDHSGLDYVAPPIELPPGLRDSVKFGYLTVPQDHDRLDGRTFRIAVAIISARTSQPASDPLVLIPGGPGSAAITEDLKRLARHPGIALFRDRRDFIIMEPRGHGFSEPELCPELEVPVVAGDSSESIMARRLSLCRSRVLANGIRLETISAVQAARDLELLRLALGAPQLNVIGGSYGSRIAAEALRQVPRTVRSVNLVAPVPAGFPHIGNRDSVADASLRELFRRCAGLPACRADYPRLADEYDSLVARVDRSPLILHVRRSPRFPEGRFRLDSRDFRIGMAELLVTPDLAAGVPLLIHTLAERGLGFAVRMAPWMLRVVDENVDVSTQHAYWCNDSPAALDTAAWLHQRCRALIGNEFGDAGSGPVRSDIPTLVQVGELDPKTPPSYAMFAAQTLSHAFVVVIPWGGHPLRGNCSFRIARDFFDAPERQPDTSCLDSIQPIEFAAGVAPSRWISSMTMSAAAHPVALGTAAGSALLLLVIGIAGLPGRGLRRLQGPGTAGVLLLWFAAVACLAMLLTLTAATFAGARQHPFIPALGVPAGWGWINVLPWIVLGLAGVTAGLHARRRWREKPPAFAILGAAGGVVLVLGLWVFHSLN